MERVRIRPAWLLPELEKYPWDRRRAAQVVTALFQSHGQSPRWLAGTLLPPAVVLLVTAAALHAVAGVRLVGSLGTDEGNDPDLAGWLGSCVR